MAGRIERSEIAKRCESNGGVAKVSLGELRETLGYGRLGTGVLREIAQDLAESGFGYFPVQTLEYNDAPRQDQVVWIYSRDGSRRSQLLDAVLRPDGHNVEQALKQFERDDVSSLSDAQRLERIAYLATSGK